jgi:hypothetical protein
MQRQGIVPKSKASLFANRCVFWLRQWID